MVQSSSEAESELGHELTELLTLIAKRQASTRAELAKRTGLARSTISQRVDRLLATGVLVEQAGGVSSGGRPPILVAINPAAGVLLGADLGVAHARVVLASLSGVIELERQFEIQITAGPERILEWLAARFDDLLEACGRSGREVRAIGMGVPGPVEFVTGTPVQPPIMPGWDGVRLPEILRQHFDVPILVDNDVNIMGLGEYSTRRLEHEQMLFVKVATGIGCGIVTDGHVLRGADGAAGDIGHVRVPTDEDVVCTCGNTNCLEAMASGSAVARQLAAVGIPARDANDVVQLCEAGNTTALRLVRLAAERIGGVLASLVNFYNPSRIILGGAIAVLRDDLLAGIRGVVYQRALPLATRNLIIETTAFSDRAGVLGATLLASEGALSPAGLARWKEDGLFVPAPRESSVAIRV